MVSENKFDVNQFTGYASSLNSQFPGLLEKGIQFIDGRTLQECHFLQFTPGLPVLIGFFPGSLPLESLLKLLLVNYRSSMEVYYLTGKLEKSWIWKKTSISKLAHTAISTLALFIPANREGASLEEFMEIIAHLRAADGCPWDRKQTHMTLRPYLLEETYEALECLDHEDINGLKEELGDILLQIALHAQIAAENGSFSISDVLASIYLKIVSRHPHVFGEVEVSDDGEVIQNWEKIKEAERAENGKEEGQGLLDGIPAILPALTQAQTIQERAARVGFDWLEIAPVLDKVMEEIEEVKDAHSSAERAEELGDLLFAVVNLVRWYKVDAESALRQSNQKFRKRFSYLEKKTAAAGRKLQKMTLEEMDYLWEEAKSLE